MNNLRLLAEDREHVQEKVAERALTMDSKKLSRAVSRYAGARAKKFFESVLESENVDYA